MTSVAFILGALPMVLAKGAGAEMRRMLGTAVFSGMIGVTLFQRIFAAPYLYRQCIDGPAADRMAMTGDIFREDYRAGGN